MDRTGSAESAPPATHGASRMRMKIMRESRMLADRDPKAFGQPAQSSLCHQGCLVTIRIQVTKLASYSYQQEFPTEVTWVVTSDKGLEGFLLFVCLGDLSLELLSIATGKQG